jgi:hypothetical protein
MRIVELTDYTMVIMKDSEDPPWVSVGDVYREAKRGNYSIMVDIDQITYHYLVTDDYIYSGGRLMLFFGDAIPPRFHLHDRVEIGVSRYNN